MFQNKIDIYLRRAGYTQMNKYWNLDKSIVSYGILALSYDSICTDAACGRHADGMRTACGRHADGMRTTCGRHADDMRTACGRHADGMRTACGRHADDMRTACGRHADDMRTACGRHADMQYATTNGYSGSDSMCADAICRADIDAVNRIALCSDSNRIRTRIGQGIPRSEFQNGSVGKNTFIRTRIEICRDENYQ